MRPSSLAWLVVGALLLIGGVWTLLGHGGGPESLAGVGPRALADAAPGAGPGDIEPVRGAEDRERASAAHAAAASGEADELPIATATVVGRLVDGAGRGVSGARVLVRRRRGGSPYPLGVARGGAADDRGWIEGESDADGRFRLMDDLEDGPLELATFAMRFAPLALADLRLGPERPLDVGTLGLLPGTVLAGRVVDRAGRGSPGAQLYSEAVRGVAGATISVPGHGVHVGATDPEGRFRVGGLAPGEWSLIVDSPDHPPCVERGRSAAGGEVLEGITIVLDPGDEITGRVLGIAGLSDALRVEARPSGEARADRPELLPRARRCELGPDGAFTLRGLAVAADYVLTLWRRADSERWERDRWCAPRTVRAGTNGVELVREGAGSLAFSLVDPAGEPVPLLQAWIGEDGGPRPRDRSLDEPLDEDEAAARRGGRVVFRDLRVPETGGRFHIRARAIGYQELVREGIPVARGEVKDLGELPLAPGAVVRALVVDERDEPVEGARVVLAQEDLELEWWLGADMERLTGRAELSAAATDADGVARLFRPTGPRLVAVAISDRHAPSAAVPVPPGPGEVGLKLALEQAGVLVVDVRDASGAPVPGVAVQRRRAGEEYGWRGDTREVTTDADGQALFERTAAGAWVLWARPDQDLTWRPPDAGDPAVATVQLAPGEVQSVALVAAGRGRLTGVVREAGEPLARAELRLLPASPGGDGRVRNLRWMRASGRYTAFTDAVGEFVLEGVACGDYQLSIEHPERVMAAVVELTVPPEGARQEVDLDVTVVSGRALTPDGRPLPGIRVAIQGGAGARAFGGGASLVEDETGDLDRDWGGRRAGATTDGAGRYVLRGVSTAEPLTLAASGPEVVSATLAGIEIGPGDVRDGVDFVLEAAGSVEVVVTGGLQGFAMVRLTLEDPENQRRIASVTRRVGVRPVVLGGLKPGTWNATLTTFTEGQSGELARGSVSVRALERARLTLRVE